MRVMGLRQRADIIRPYERTGNVSIESVGAHCVRPLRANTGNYGMPATGRHGHCRFAALCNTPLREDGGRGVGRGWWILFYFYGANGDAFA